MGKNTRYWTAIDELHQTDAAREALTTEFSSNSSVDFLSDPKLKETNTGRRDFLKYMGFGLAAATLAACETPVVKSIPYVVKPEEITPGVANYYASTYYDGIDYGNILVKTREGRPIHIKGNKEFGLAAGAVNSRINASVIGLYDSARLRQPRIGSKDSDWSAVDTEVANALNASSSIRLVTPTVISPSVRRAISEMAGHYPGKFKHIVYDTISYSGITQANLASHGKAVVPSYDFSKAHVIVSFGADFLGTWITPNIFSSQYAEGRKPEAPHMSKHYQIESIMSLTGSNADVRMPIKPSDEGRAVVALHAALTGGTAANPDGFNADTIAKDLMSAKGKSLIVSSSNDKNIQLIVNDINRILGNYGETIHLDKHTNFYQGSDAEMAALVEELNNGNVDTVIFVNTNPSYSWSDADKFNNGLAKAKNSVSISLFADETASRCKIIAPDHHFLESWGDFEPVAGRIDLAQPTINPLYNTRPALESILRWTGNASYYYDYIRQTHVAGYTPAMMKTDSQWNMAVHNGTFAGSSIVADTHSMTSPADSTSNAAAAAPAMAMSAPVAAAPSANLSEAIAAATAMKGGDWEVVFYQKVTMGAGHHANNPYLQETPDPITKTTWDNYITMSPLDVKELKMEAYLGQRDAASLATVTINGKSMTLPVVPTPGQKRKTIGIALGYGRGAGNEEIGRAAYQTGGKGEHLMDGEKRMPVGKNAYPLLPMSNGSVQYYATGVSLSPTGEEYPIATTQMHSTVMGRDSVVKETTLSIFTKEKDKKKGEASYNPLPTLPVHEDVNGDSTINNKDRVYIREMDLWRDHPVENVGHRWGLTIDLTSCIGCGSCITACHTENNVPVVGKDEVLRHRDMHWMRIDRYFSSEYETLEETEAATGKGVIGAYRHMEDPSENPKTVHMPMMCQHCNHAPCETVCPVAATTHSNEGLNNMAYNRCIGTRYCANNCPYKVRRFNWFNYLTNDKFAIVNPAQDEMTRMVLNPDVTVRSRGVMEKCSMCQQRIQAGKLEAKKAGVAVPDGSIQTACMEACPTHAIVFGDLNDKESKNHQRAQNVRSYHALEEVGIQPNIYYMTKVRNISENAEA
jgi:molybdopterin-containing oxidoreductase family iron-sulfur binding subunit